MYDIIIVGSGPAGLTAAIYAKRASKSVLVFEKDAMGGTITHSPKIENYPGYESLSGVDLAFKFVDHATNMGVEFEYSKVTKVEKVGKTFEVYNDFGDKFEAKSVIIASGSKHRTLGQPNEENLVGHGISYCAVCDGPFATGKDVIMIGGGNSALQEAILLASYCKSVTMVQNLAFLTGEKALIEQVLTNEKIKVIYNNVVEKLYGENELTAIDIKNVETGEITNLPTSNVFVAIGQVADNEPFDNVCELDKNGFIVSDNDCNSNIEGIYVAGDCRVKKIRQVVTATSDGSVAALQAIRYVDSI